MKIHTKIQLGRAFFEEKSKVTMRHIQNEDRVLTRQLQVDCSHTKSYVTLHYPTDFSILLILCNAI